MADASPDDPFECWMATGARLGFQVSENYQRPDWPDHRRVLTQGHLDIGVLTGDYDRVSDFAVSLGACVTVPRSEMRVVLLDAVGHPFCLMAAAVFDESAGGSEVRRVRVGSR